MNRKKDRLTVQLREKENLISQMYSQPSAFLMFADQILFPAPACGSRQEKRQWSLWSATSKADIAQLVIVYFPFALVKCYKNHVIINFIVMSCGYALSNSYASFVLSNLPRTSGKTRWLHSARLPFLNSTERASHSCIYVIMTFQRTCNCGNITKNKVHDETVFVNSCDGDCSARGLVAEVLLENVYQRKGHELEQIHCFFFSTQLLWSLLYL